MFLFLMNVAFNNKCINAVDVNGVNSKTVHFMLILFELTLNNMVTTRYSNWSGDRGHTAPLLYTALQHSLN